MYKVRAQKGKEIVFSLGQTSGGFRYINMANAEYTYGSRTTWTPLGGNQGQPASACSIQLQHGFGCGVSCLISGMTYILGIEEESWTKGAIESFRECFRQLFSFSATTGIGSAVMCITDSQMKDGAGTFKAWEREFVLHKAGHFPNYNHGPSNMHLFYVNVAPRSKAIYPLSYDIDFEKRAKAKKAGVPFSQYEEKQDAEEIPLFTTRGGYVRDAHGRFASKQPA